MHSEDDAPRLSDEARWYTEHTALLISTLKWALLGAGAGLCVGFGTRGFLWSLSAAGAAANQLTLGAFPPFLLLPIAMPLCVWLIRTFAPDARGHGTEAVIAAVHQRSGRINWRIAPVKLAGTVLTLAFGGSVGKEGPAASRICFASPTPIGAGWSSAASARDSRRSSARRSPVRSSASKCCTSDGSTTP